MMMMMMMTMVLVVVGEFACLVLASSVGTVVFRK
jgi:hypothetical protein